MIIRPLQLRCKVKTGWVLAVLLLLTPLLNISARAAAREPRQDLEKNVSSALAILSHPRRNEAGNKEVQLQALWDLLLKSFDFREFSRRVLASHWKRFTAAEREAFVDVFSRFLGRFYLRKVVDLYKGERVIYIDQEKVGDSRAVVSVEVLRKGLKIPVKVKMIEKDGSWKVYDLVFLGISGVSNYRAQFRNLLKSQSPAQVIASIRDRMEKQ